MKKWRMWTVIAIVFISGAVVGSGVTGFYVKHRVRGILHGDPSAVKIMIMKELTDELKLTPDQQGEIAGIVERTQLRVRELRMQYRPRMDAIINDGFADMKKGLSPEQQKKLEELHEKMKLRFHRRKAG